MRTCLQTTLHEKVSALSINLVKQAAVKLRSNEILVAKETHDELLAALDVKLVTNLNSSESILP